VSYLLSRVQFFGKVLAVISCKESGLRSGLIGWFLVSIAVAAGGQEFSITTSDAAKVDVRISVSAPGEAPSHNVQIQTPWVGAFGLEDSTPWRLHLEASGYWHPSALLEEGLEIVLLPAAELTVSSEDTDLYREDLRLLVQRYEEPGEEWGQHDVVCSPGEPWRCRLPVGRLDIRLSTAGHAPIYLWDVAILEENDPALGPLTFIPGGSINGWVRWEGGGNRLHAEVVAIPVGAPSILNLEEKPRNRLREIRVRPNAKGFFQLQGVPPGTFDLRAEQEGYGSSRITVSIGTQGEELVLDQMLDLTPLATVEFVLQPSTDPWGKAWVLTLDRRFSHENLYTTWAKKEADETGTWKVQGVPPATFMMTVADSRGSEWLTEELEVWHGRPTTYFEIDVVPVVGNLSYGAKGIPGRVVFGTTNGVESITMEADDEGDFSGFLPFEGNWPVELRLGGGWASQATEPVTIRRLKGEKNAEIKIALPETLLQGAVTAGGEPAARAFVVGIRQLSALGQGNPERRREISLETKDGKFEIRGLSEGELRLQAYHLDVASDWLVLELKSKVPREVTLELQEKVMIDGVVTTTPGAGVIGAKILAIPDIGIATSAQTGLDGSFRLQLAAEVRTMSLVVIPPGHGVFFHGAMVGEEPRPKLRLSTAENAGDIVITNPQGQSILFHGGVGIPLRKILSLLSPSGRIGPHPREGLLLKGMATGTWSLCSGVAYDEAGCTTGTVFPNTEIRLDLRRGEGNEHHASE
jgi:hypothetical protein